MRLLYHVGREMRLLSSIIKHSRINQLGTIQLGEPKKSETLISDTNDIQESYKEKYNMAEKEALRLKEEAKRNARQILEQAREEADSLLNQAKLQQEELLEIAYLEMDEARKIVADEKRIIIADAHKEKDAIIQEAINQKEKILEQIEPEMVSIIKNLLNRIIDKQVVGSGQWLEWIVRKMIRTENINESIIVRISEECYEAYSSMLESQLGDFKYGVHIERDRTLNDFSCAIEATTGTIYYDVKEGLDEVLKELDMLQSLSE